MSIILNPIAGLISEYVTKVRLELSDQVLTKQDDIDVEVGKTSYQTYNYPILNSGYTLYLLSGTSELTLIEGTDYSFVEFNDGKFNILCGFVKGDIIRVSYRYSTFSDSLIEEKLTQSLNGHNTEISKAYAWSDLPTTDSYLVIWLSESLLCYSQATRMLNSALYADVKSGNIMTSGSESATLDGLTVTAPLTQGVLNSSVVKELSRAWKERGATYEELYNERCGIGKYADIRKTSMPEIQVGVLLRDSKRTGQRVSYNVAPTPIHTVTLDNATSVSSSGCELSWNEILDINFYLWKVIINTSTITKPTSTTPFIVESNIYDPHENGATITGLESTTQYYGKVYFYTKEMLFVSSNSINFTTL